MAQLARLSIDRGARWRLRRQPSGPGRRHAHTFAEARAAVLARTCSRREEAQVLLASADKSG
jgi:hypothetical protein